MKIPFLSSLPTNSTPETMLTNSQPSLSIVLTLSLIKASLAAIFWNLIPITLKKFNSLVSSYSLARISWRSDLFLDFNPGDLILVYSLWSRSSNELIILDLPIPLGMIDSITVKEVNSNRWGISFLWLNAAIVMSNIRPRI